MLILYAQKDLVVLGGKSEQTGSILYTPPVLGAGTTGLKARPVMSRTLQTNSDGFGRMFLQRFLKTLRILRTLQGVLFRKKTSQQPVFKDSPPTIFLVAQYI